MAGQEHSARISRNAAGPASNHPAFPAPPRATLTEITEPLVRAAQKGDNDASRTIVEALQRPVLATIFRFLGPAWRRDVEDLAQEVFLKVFRALPSFDPARAKFTTWVYTFVRNHCYDVL